MKERLIELIGKGERSMWGKSIHGIKGQREALADFLLENEEAEKALKERANK